jgi:hypothetical protein
MAWLKMVVFLIPHLARQPNWMLPFYFFILIAAIGAVRSCIHIFSPDGGAGSIAGMDLSVSGANEVIFAFALWGSAQLIYALLQWGVILRYRSLIPLCGSFSSLKPSGGCWSARSSQLPSPTPRPEPFKITFTWDWQWPCWLWRSGAASGMLRKTIHDRRGIHEQQMAALVPGYTITAQARHHFRLYWRHAFISAN